MIENENSEEVGQEVPDSPQACCPSGSAGGDCCPSPSSDAGKQWKAIIFAVIVLAAGVVAARSLINKSDSAGDQTPQTFAGIEQVAEFEAASLWGEPLDSLESLNEAAGAAQAVFVLLAIEDQQKMEAVIQEVEAAAEKIQTNGTGISAFVLKKGTPDHLQLSEQFSPPCVLAMVKGCGANPVSGEITEGKLIQAFVAASRPSSGCGPAGCGPAGCCP
jgi:hypothetical protein